MKEGQANGKNSISSLASSIAFLPGWTAKTNSKRRRSDEGCRGRIRNEKQTAEEEIKYRCDGKTTPRKEQEEDDK